MEQVRFDIFMAVRFNANVPHIYATLLEARSKPVELPPL